MKKSFRSIAAGLTLLALLSAPAAVLPNTAYAKDNRPVVIQYKDSEGKNLHRLLDNSVQFVDVNGYRLISAQTIHLIDVGFDWFGVAKTHNYVRGSTHFWLFRPTAEGKAQFNGWYLDGEENITNARNDLQAFYSALDTSLVTDPDKAQKSCTNIKRFVSIGKYMQENYPDMFREALAYNTEHAAEIMQHSEAKAVAASQGDRSAMADTFAQAYGKSPSSYISTAENFTWADFLNNGVNPEIDVNWLIHNLWYVESVGDSATKTKFIARFTPFIWHNVGDDKRTIKTLELTKIYDSENKKCCYYLGEAHAYDGKQATFDSANFIMNMDSNAIPQEDTGDVNTINVVDMDNGSLVTRQVYPSPWTFHKSSATPESFTMEENSTLWAMKTTYRFTRIK